MRWLALTLLLASPASAQTRLRVAPGSSCDESLRRELSRIAATKLVETDAEVSASLNAKPPGWKLKVERAGAEALERSLDARDCAEAAFAAAVVVERYLHELAKPKPVVVVAPKKHERPPSPAVTAPPPETASIPAPPPPSAATPAPSDTTPPPPPETPATTTVSPNTVVISQNETPPPETTPAAEQPPAQTAEQIVAPPSAPLLRLQRWELAINGAAWAPAPNGTRFALGLEGAIFFDPAWRASLELAGGLPEEQVIVVDDVTRGTVSVETFNALLTVGRCIDRELRPCLALVGGARLARGTSSGDLIFHQKAAFLVRPSFGLAIQLHWLPWNWLFSGLEIVGLWNPVHAEFDLQGVSAATVTFPTFEVLFRLSFGASVTR